MDWLTTRVPVASSTCRLFSGRSNAFASSPGGDAETEYQAQNLGSDIEPWSVQRLQLIKAASAAYIATAMKRKQSIQVHEHGWMSSFLGGYDDGSVKETAEEFVVDVPQPADRSG